MCECWQFAPELVLVSAGFDAALGDHWYVAGSCYNEILILFINLVHYLSLSEMLWHTTGILFK